MSHMTTISIEVRDLEALEQACRRLGLTLVRGKNKARFYNHNTAECDHVIEVPASAHDIGVVKEADGTYRLQTDFYGMEGERVKKLCGDDLSKLMQAYGVEKSKVEARRKGFSCFEEVMQDGTIRVKARRVVA